MIRFLIAVGVILIGLLLVWQFIVSPIFFPGGVPSTAVTTYYNPITNQCIYQGNGGAVAVRGQC